MSKKPMRKSQNTKSAWRVRSGESTRLVVTCTKARAASLRQRPHRQRHWLVRLLMLLHLAASPQAVAVPFPCESSPKWLLRKAVPLPKQERPSCRKPWPSPDKGDRTDAQMRAQRKKRRRARTVRVVSFNGSRWGTLKRWIAACRHPCILAGQEHRVLPDNLPVVTQAMARKGWQVGMSAARYTGERQTDQAELDSKHSSAGTLVAAPSSMGMEPVFGEVGWYSSPSELPSEMPSAAAGGARASLST